MRRGPDPCQISLGAKSMATATSTPPVRHRQLFWKRLLGSPTAAPQNPPDQSNYRAPVNLVRPSTSPSRPSPSSSSRGPREAAPRWHSTDVHSRAMLTDYSQPQTPGGALSLQRWRKALGDYLLAYRALDMGSQMAGSAPRLPRELIARRRKKLHTLIEGSSIASSSARSLAFTSSSVGSLLQDSSAKQLIGLVPDSSRDVTQLVHGTLPRLVQTSPEPDVDAFEDGPSHFANAAAELLMHTNNMGFFETDEPLGDRCGIADRTFPRAAFPFNASGQVAKKLCQPGLGILAEDRSSSIDEPSAQPSMNPVGGSSSSLILSGGRPLKTKTTRQMDACRAEECMRKPPAPKPPVPKQNLPRHDTEARRTLREANSNTLIEALGKEDELAKASTIVRELAKDAEQKIVSRKYRSLVDMARMYHVPLEELRDICDEFESYDTSQSGEISKSTFCDLIRARCNLPAHNSVPIHLTSSIEMTESARSESVSFEDFLFWSMHLSYSEEYLVPNPQDRNLRKLAREQHMLLPDVEKIKRIFDGFDTDGSGEIEKNEFKHILYRLMDVNEADVSDKKMERYWKELDWDGSGAVSFDEFLVWYATLFPQGAEGKKGNEPNLYNEERKRPKQPEAERSKTARRSVKRRGSAK